MIKSFYNILQKKLAAIEQGIFEISKSKVDDGNFRHYSTNLVSYFGYGIKYIFYGTLEGLVKLFVLLTRNPEDGYKVLIAPLEKFELAKEEIRKEADFSEYHEYHKKTKKFSLGAMLASVVAVVLVSLLVTFLIPVKDKIFAASYTWSQSDWSVATPTDSSTCASAGSAGGTWTGTDCTATDPTDRTGWNTYTSTTTGMTATTGVSLLAGSETFVDAQTPTIPAGGAASGGDFDLGTNNNTNLVDTTGQIKLASVFVCGETVSGYATQSIGGYCFTSTSLGTYSHPELSGATDAGGVCQATLGSNWRLGTSTEWNSAKGTLGVGTARWTGTAYSGSAYYIVAVNQIITQVNVIGSYEIYCVHN